MDVMYENFTQHTFMCVRYFFFIFSLWLLVTADVSTSVSVIFSCCFTTHLTRHHKGTETSYYFDPATYSLLYVQWNNTEFVGWYNYRHLYFHTKLQVFNVINHYATHYLQNRFTKGKKGLLTES